MNKTILLFISIVSALTWATTYIYTHYSVQVSAHMAEDPPAANAIPTPVIQDYEHIGNRYIAHRGYSAAAPENTIPAFQLARDKGADGIELDIRMTKDGKAVVLHDYSLDRTTNGKGLVKDLTYAEIRSYNAGLWFTKHHYPDTSIPLLSEVLQTVNPLGTQMVYAEIKGYNSPSDVWSMVNTVIDSGLEGRTVFSSFNYEDFIYIRERSRAVKIAYLCGTVSSCQESVKLAKADGNAMIHANFKTMLDEERLAREAQQYGIEIAAWTVNRADFRQKLENIGIHTFITDEPVLLKQP